MAKIVKVSSSTLSHSRTRLYTELSDLYIETSGVFESLRSAKDMTLEAKEKAEKELKGTIDQMAKELGVSKAQVAQALSDPKVMNLLKAFGYSALGMWNCVGAVGKLANKGLFTVMEKLHETKAMQAIHKGTIKVDEVLDKHPILKKVAGPAMAGLLLVGWMSMSFVGDADADFDMTHIAAAAAGNFSFADSMTSPTGMSMMALTVAGIATGGALSFPWLGHSALNLMAGVAYTVSKNAQKIPALKALADKIKAKVGDKMLTAESPAQSVRGGKDFKHDVEDTGLPVSTSASDSKSTAPAASSSDNAWWDSMSEAQQKQYVQDHPNSKYAGS